MPTNTNNQKGGSNNGNGSGRSGNQNGSTLQHNVFNESAVHRPVPGQGKGNGGKKK